MEFSSASPVASGKLFDESGDADPNQRVADARRRDAAARKKRRPTSPRAGAIHGVSVEKALECDYRMRRMPSTPTSNWVLVTPDPLSLDGLTSWATRRNCGAVVTFSGVVRDNSSARDHVLALEYETSVDLAEKRIHEVIDEARVRWRSLEAVAIHHRIGRVELSDETVIVAVSAPHRDDAFDAARFCIDTLKVSVPMWKREVWEGGSAWSDDASPIVNARDQ
ncbi:MAG: molybdenum cofactor biosynthesis protein MoaE [Acidimicrobiales bacterium]